MSNDQRLHEIFNYTILNRNTIRYKLNRTFFDYISFMQAKIRKQLKTFTLMSICGGQRSKFTINQYFENAYIALTLQQKVKFFDKTINLIKKAQQYKSQNIFSIQNTQMIKIKNKYGQQAKVIIQINTGFRSWDQEIITISGFKITSQKKINIDLRNYLIRKSKKKDVNCHVLQAVRLSKPQTIRFCFKRKQDEQKYFPMILELLNLAQLQNICKEAFSLQLGIIKKNPKTGKTKISLLEETNKNVFRNIEIKENINNEFDQDQELINKIPHQTSVSYQLMKSKDQQQIYQDLKDLIEKQNQQAALAIENKIQTNQNQIIAPRLKKNFKNIFSIMLPNYNLSQIQSLKNYQTIYSQNQKELFIYKNIKNSNQFKMQMIIQLPIEKVILILLNVQIYKTWHPFINQSQLKFRISSQNCSIFYQKIKSYSQWYKQRDYLYLKHQFQYQDAYYLIDKSFQNTNFIPFHTIVRGKINHCVTKIIKNQKGTKIIMDIQINNGGLLNQNHSQQLTLNYLKGFSNLKQHFSIQESFLKLSSNYYLNWNIQETFKKQDFKIEYKSDLTLEAQDFQKIQQISQMDQSDLYFSVDDLDKQQINQHNNSQHQIQQQDLVAKQQILKQSFVEIQSIKINQQGRIIVPKNYIKKKHIVKPLTEKTNIRIEKKFDNIILQDNWQHLSQGGLQIINQKKIQAQNNVFGFILKKLRQNIFSGNGLKNISLPVQVFNCDSNLSRVCKGFSLAPQFLQKASKIKDPVQRMKYSILFGLSSSLFYLDAQKPFNPILGETYQGLIDGCPVYAQQISHHPPISSFYMVGRGYKIYGNIQAKVNLHVNSADGINQGFNFIEFDDGQIIGFTTPPGEVSNTTMGGNRKFNFLDKGCYFDEKNKLYCQVRFKQQGGFFGKTKWKYRDQVQAQIFKVKENFNQQVKEKIISKKSPTQKQIQQKMGKLNGRWLFQVIWNNQIRYRPNQDLPFQIKNYDYPLASDCFYRQDIYYRIKEDLSRSQIEKQRLEVIQRNDRKQRQKYCGKAH